MGRKVGMYAPKGCGVSRLAVCTKETNQPLSNEPLTFLRHCCCVAVWYEYVVRAHTVPLQPGLVHDADTTSHVYLHHPPRSLQQQQRLAPTRTYGDRSPKTTRKYSNTKYKIV